MPPSPTRRYQTWWPSTSILPSSSFIVRRLVFRVSAEPIVTAYVAATLRAKRCKPTECAPYYHNPLDGVVYLELDLVAQPVES
jgi:hypothetical protein